MTQDLSRFRAQLAAIDSRILELIAERQKLSEEIGNIKMADGLPTRNFKQERDVIERAREKAVELGLRTEIAEQIATLLIRSSLTIQERDRVSANTPGGGKSVLIIGGAGKMGQWTGRFLRSQGFSVSSADPTHSNTDEDHCYQRWQDAGTDFDLIVVAAPLKVSNQVLIELASAKPRGLIFDIGSLKTPLRAGLSALADARCNVTSIHPMFGPDTELLSGRHVIFVDVGNPEATEQAKALFRATMATHVDMDLDSHDRHVAYVLGLSHALNLCFVTALAESGETARTLAGLSSTTFDAQLEVTRRVVLDNPHLYFEIQHANDYGTESLSALLYATERLRSVVRSGDEKGFVALMKQGQEYLSTRRAAQGSSSNPAR